MPPSHNAVIYSLATGGTISIISLFLAASCRACCSASR
jgi:TRAP-type C4-dicarboxylate transport system permease large subunit